MASIESSTVASQQGLCKQDLAKLDVAELTALSPEVISRQATINIGTIGHVAHGKSTVVKAVSGVQTVRFKNELERNITIKLEDVKEAETAPVHLDDVVKATKAVNGNTSGGQRETIRKPTKRRAIENASANSKRTTNRNPAVSENIAKRNSTERKRTNNRLLTVNKRKKSCSKPGTALKRCKRVKKPSEEKKDDVEYEVEKIICHKFLRGKHLYFVKWENWSDIFNTWEPIEHLSGCLPMLFEFFDKKAGKYCEKEFQELKYKLTIFNKDELIELMKEYHTGNSIKIPKPDLSDAEYMLKILSRIPSVERDPGLLQLVRREYMIDSLYKKRVKQVEALEEWENEMNTISMDSAPLTVVNLVDLEEPPENFIYINDYLPGTDVYISDDPPIGCSCENCTAFSHVCCGRSFGVRFGYDKDLKIRVPFGSPVYECNKKCKCPPSCVNRVVQRGRQIKLCIFRTNNGCGWGVKTLEDIPKGAFVTEYIGEVITFEEAEKRGKTYDRQGKTYLFDLDFNDANHFPFTVDAAFYGNVSHFINHSCDPNMRVFAVWINCLDPNLPKLSFFASRDIKRGEEISFDYLCQSPATSKTNNKLDEVDDRLGFKMYCKCGSRRCRQYYF